MGLWDVLLVDLEILLDSLVDMWGQIFSSIGNAVTQLSIGFGDVLGISIGYFDTVMNTLTDALDAWLPPC